jgi:SOS-response transcriptional repressor LexA
MRSEGILPDDIVIMERGKKPQHGSIVIAEIDGTTMIRRYELHGGTPRLVDGNGGEQIIEEGNEVRLLGVVTSVIRKY